MPWCKGHCLHDELEVDWAAVRAVGGSVEHFYTAQSGAARCGAALCMHVDMCTDICVDMCVDMCVDRCVDMCVDVCVVMCVGTCVDSVWTCVWTDALT